VVNAVPGDFLLYAVSLFEELEPGSGWLMEMALSKGLEKIII
jgi:hypothetical protein